MARANPGDLVVLCVDKHPVVLAELEHLTQHAQAGARSGEAVGDPDLDPQEMHEAAQVAGARAAAVAEA
jgi:cyanophycin synthetase